MTDDTTTEPQQDTRPPRAIVVVDLETSALEPDNRISGLFAGIPVGDVYGVAVEAAWWNLTTGEHGSFVPRHNVRTVRAYGAAGALTVCRYLERLADAPQDDGTEAKRLHAQLDGNTLAGSNPAFDAAFLRQLFAREDVPAPWHHRLLDLSAYAAGYLDVPGNHLPGLARVCERLGVDRPDHTAAGDVRATGECLMKLGALAEEP